MTAGRERERESERELEREREGLPGTFTNCTSFELGSLEVVHMIFGSLSPARMYSSSIGFQGTWVGTFRVWWVGGCRVEGLCGIERGSPRGVGAYLCLVVLHFNLVPKLSLLQMAANIRPQSVANTLVTGAGREGRGKSGATEKCLPTSSLSSVGMGFPDSIACLSFLFLSYTILSLTSS